MIAKMPKNSKNRKLWGYLYVMIGSMHMGTKFTHSSTYGLQKLPWLTELWKGLGWAHTLLKRGTYFHMPQTLITLIFNKNLLGQHQKNPSNFGYYIKTENYEVFIPKIAREVYHLEHRKLRKRKLRGRKLRGHRYILWNTIHLVLWHVLLCNECVSYTYLSYVFLT